MSAILAAICVLAAAPDMSTDEALRILEKPAVSAGDLAEARRVIEQAGTVPENADALVPALLRVWENPFSQYCAADLAVGRATRRPSSTHAGQIVSVQATRRLPCAPTAAGRSVRGVFSSLSSCQAPATMAWNSRSCPGSIRSGAEPDIRGSTSHVRTARPTVHATGQSTVGSANTAVARFGLGVPGRSRPAGPPADHHGPGANDGRGGRPSDLLPTSVSGARGISCR